MSTQSIFNMVDSWNAAGTTFTAVKMNVTDTASAAGSALIDLQVGGVSQFKVSKAGAVTAVGVAIPTISSTDTLSNKTLSSPTISGTISGSPTISGSWVLSGSTYPLRTGDGAYLQFYNGSTGSNIAIGKPNADDLYIYVGATPAVKFFSTGGVNIGAPTGGDKGAGTLNCTGAYDDNVLLTDLVLDYAVAGTFDAVRYANHPLKDQVAPWWFNPDQYAKFWKAERRLPGMLTWDDPANKPSTGESITRLTAVVEMQAALIENLNQRLKELEK
jgi:hypothetical protein